jgi:hypothetical protein
VAPPSRCLASGTRSKYFRVARTGSRPVTVPEAITSMLVPTSDATIIRPNQASRRAKPPRISAAPRCDQRSHELAQPASTSVRNSMANIGFVSKLKKRGICPTGMCFSLRARRWLDEPLQLSRLNRRSDRRTHNKLAQIQSFADGPGGGQCHPVTSLPIST